jgi:succinyl-diaminopimelate desuccinylase
VDCKAEVLRWIEQDRDVLVGFLSELLKAKSPNPPGDTRSAGKLVEEFLAMQGLSYRLVSAHPEMPNYIGTFEAAVPGKHLVLNGHLDVFPVDENMPWTHGPWSGDVADGKIWGRGAVDMKCGTTASLFTFAYLNRLRDRLKGRLTLTVVSDEETFGPYGARYLMEHHPEIHGDCCLSGEPSDPRTVRFGEKGPLWLRFQIKTQGAHGAYPHASASAAKIAVRLILELESLEVEIPPPGNIGTILESSKEAIEAALGQGASEILQKITSNIGLITGGVKVNMIPSSCSFELDLRLPIGAEKNKVLAGIREIVGRYPEASFEEFNFSPPNWCDPKHEMVDIIRANVRNLRGFDPQPIVGLGATDMRLWRDRGIPAYVYGPSPRTMGAADEHVEIEEFLHILRTHACSACDYLS